MVALAGPGWRLAPSLIRLMEECDRRAPDRSTASDGSKGDSAHSARKSDHNPAGGYVTAVDVTDDKAAGCDADLLARHIVAGRDPRVKYVIWNGTIVQSAKGWVPETYRGPNAHFQHTHVSIHNTPSARNDLSPWWPTPRKGLFMHLTEAEEREILDHVRHLDPFPPEKLNSIGEKDPAGVPASRHLRWISESLNNSPDAMTIHKRERVQNL